MPAFHWEIRRAEEEGVKIDCSVGPQRILSKYSKVSGVSLAKVKAIERDEAGRIKPTFLGGSEKVMDADIVVVAIGQAPSLSSLGTDLKVNPRTLTTNLSGVYAGGDVASGPSMVVKAMAAGKIAARYIHRYLNSKPEYLELVRKHSEKLSQEEYRSRIQVQNRCPTQGEAPGERNKDFREIERTYSQRNAQAEARRCVGRRICSEYYEEPQRSSI
jgi:heterodisulfide reductase subunit A-like polyferredoxin